MFDSILAAAGPDLGPVQTIVQNLSDGLFKMGAPLAVIGIVIGGAAARAGFAHGAHALRVSVVALVVCALAKVLATAMFGSG